MSILGQTLSRRRKQLGLTLREMERKTGMSNPYLCQVENGQVPNPSVLAVVAMADGYRIPAWRLVKAIVDDDRKEE